VAAGLALGIIMVGAWVRLSAAGLGCVDWPACYATNHITGMDLSGYALPANLLVALTGGLALLVIGLFVIARRNRQQRFQPQRLPVLLLPLVIIQLLLASQLTAILNQPIAVLLYLLLALLNFCLLFWLGLRSREQRPASPPGEARRLLPWIIIGLLLTGIQTMIGGWTAVNYAALACPDIPTCQNSWWPPADFYQGFVFWQGLNENVQPLSMGAAAQLAIQLTHRVGALVLLFVITVLSLKMMRRRSMDIPGRLLLTMLPIQLILGVLQVALELPLPVVMAHSAGGALLLACLLYSLHRVMPRRDR